MEAKLEEFRRRRKRELLVNKTKDFFSGIMKGFTSPVEVEANAPLIDNSATPHEVDSEIDDNSSILSDRSIDASITCPSWLQIAIYFFCILLWLITALVAAHFEFGLVYIVVSCLVFICLNTRTRPKTRGEVSAYSVFNPNCKAIDGTLKAEQFEREFNLIRHENSTSPKSY